MFQQYVNFVIKQSTGKTAVVLLIVYIIFNAAVMGWGAKHINSLSGKKVQVLDLCLTGYSPAEVNAYLKDYTPEARNFAATFNAIADTAYPIVYTIMLSVLLAWVYKSRIIIHKSFGYLLLFPLLMMVLDFLENYHIIAMLRKFPEIPEAIIRAGSILTVAKWGMFGMVLAAIVFGLVLKVINGKKTV
jgi:hypothetical protein